MRARSGDSAAKSEQRTAAILAAARLLGARADLQKAGLLADAAARVSLHSLMRVWQQYGRAISTLLGSLRWTTGAQISR